MEKLIDHLNERFIIRHDKGRVFRKRDGKECTTSDSYGYTQVCCGKFEGKRKIMKRHQIIFLTYHGYLPENSVDHEDEDKKNDSIGNLRPSTHQLQQRNITRKSLGITRRGPYYRARIRDSEGKQHEKSTRCYEEALAWRTEKEAELW